MKQTLVVSREEVKVGDVIIASNFEGVVKGNPKLFMDVSVKQLVHHISPKGSAFKVIIDNGSGALSHRWDAKASTATHFKVEREVGVESAADVLARVGGLGTVAAQVKQEATRLADHVHITITQTPKRSKFEEFSRALADGMTGEVCFARFQLNMRMEGRIVSRETDKNGYYKLTQSQKALASMMWTEQLQEKKAAQATVDASKEISIICENQFADGDE